MLPHAFNSELLWKTELRTQLLKWVTINNLWKVVLRLTSICFMTFAPICSVTRADYLNTFEFLDKLAENLKIKLASQPKLWFHLPAFQQTHTHSNTCSCTQRHLHSYWNCGPPPPSNATPEREACTQNSRIKSKSVISQRGTVKNGALSTAKHNGGFWSQLCIATRQNHTKSLQDWHWAMTWWLGALVYPDCTQSPEVTCQYLLLICATQGQYWSEGASGPSLPY